MTKDQAYERLELPIDTDLQTARKKFAEMHNDYRMRIENAPTPRLKQTFESGLEELKEAYALLNESDGMDDAAELPRTERSFDKQEAEEKDASTPSLKMNLSQALAAFGLDKEQDVAIAERTIEKYLGDLRQQLATASLPAVQQAFKQELARAEFAKVMILDELTKLDQVTTKERQQKAVNQTLSAPFKRVGPTIQTDQPTASSKSKASNHIVKSAVLIAVMTGGYYLYNHSFSSFLNENTLDVERDSSAGETALTPDISSAYEQKVLTDTVLVQIEEESQVVLSSQKQKTEQEKMKSLVKDENGSNEFNTVSSRTFDTLTYANGSKYVGQIQNGKAHGQGKMNWSSGIEYNGEWRNNKRNGQGTLTWSSGEYVGEWKDDKQDGHGKAIWSTGDKYLGEWKDNKRNGQGTYTYQIGSKYIGKWKDDKRDGQGTFTSANNNKDIGEWKNGKEYNIVRYNANGNIIKKWIDGIEQL